MSAIPDLIKIGQIPVDMNMSIDTDVLEPVVKSNTFCRFTLINKGFMNSFSKIVLATTNPSASGNLATYPINVGINSLIQRATLKVGAKTISEVEDFNHFMGYKSRFIDNDIMKEREQVLTSRNMALELEYNNASGTYSYQDAGAYGLSNGNTYITNLTGATAREGLLPYIWQEAISDPEFQVSLADLFPFLRYNSLPLFMFDEQISIELTFEPNATNRMSNPNASATDHVINQPSLQLIADYIYYDQAIMEQFANANANMNFQYTDYQLNKRTLTQAQAQTKQILNIGGAGRICPKMFWSLSDNSGDENSITNIYHSTSPLFALATGARDMGILTTNVRYNDKYLYPIDRVSNSIHFHDIVSAEGNTPHISRDMYSTGGLGVTTQTFNGFDQNSLTEGISGKFFYQANRLNRNERINSRGIELELQYSSIAAGTYTQRTWLEVIRSATLKNGILDTTFA